MNIQTSITPNSLLWGCIYFALTVTVYNGDSVKANNITIVPLNNTNVFTNDSSNTYTNEEVKLLVSSESFDGTTIVGSDKASKVLNGTGELGNDKSTSPPDDLDKNESKESRLNLAVIPVVAILIFVTALCLKCCSWFRQYTRGAKHASGASYDIVEQGDTDFDQIDIRSDSASTVYYDTVSSICSFLRRNDSELTGNSFKGSKLEQLKHNYNVSERLLNDVRKRMADLDAIDSDLVVRNEKSQNCRNSPSKPDSGSSDSVFSPTDTSKSLTYSPKRRAIRTPSGSSDVSAETEQSLLSDTEKDTPKRQRFKVSFVTEDSNTGRTNNRFKDAIALKPIITNTRTSNATMTDALNIHRPRAHSDDTPNKYCFPQMPENDFSNKSSKVVCKADIERDSVGNKIRTVTPGARPKISPILIKRPILRSKEQTYNASVTGQGGMFVARKVLYGKLRSISEPPEAIRGAIPRMKECGTQTDKSFRLSIRKGRQRYLSEVNADENIIPPTISELVEMCSCKLTENKHPVSRDNVCICDNSPDDISPDDVFQANENDLNIANACDSESVNHDIKSGQENDRSSDAENRLTNHERSKERMRTEDPLFIPNIDKPCINYKTDMFNSGIMSDISPTHGIGKLSSSTHNIREIKNDSNGNLLGKYCDKCHYFNKSVPNLCYACQKHSLPADIIAKAVNDKQLKNRCKSCSQFTWTNSVNRGLLLRQNNVHESEIELSALDVLKHESSLLASDDLSVSSSSLSSSGYVDISSDVSSL